MLKRTALFLILCLPAFPQNPNTATFPSQLLTDEVSTVAKDRSVSVLDASIDADDLTLVVDAGHGSRFIQFEIITIEDEQMMVCSVAGDTLTICPGTRGFSWTTAVSHSNGSDVSGNYVEWIVNQLNAEMKAVQTLLDTNGNGVLRTKVDSTTAAETTITFQPGVVKPGFRVGCGPLPSTPGTGGVLHCNSADTNSPYWYDGTIWRNLATSFTGIPNRGFERTGTNFSINQAVHGYDHGNLIVTVYDFDTENEIDAAVHVDRTAPYAISLVGNLPSSRHMWVTIAGWGGPMDDSGAENEPPNVKAAPYYASGAGTTTTTSSGSTASGANSVTLANGSSWTPGMGIWIAGAGVSGANYVGTCSAKPSANVCTLDSPTGTTVANGTVVKHDDTAAFTAACITSDRRCYVPEGYYLISSTLLFDDKVTTCGISGAGSNIDWGHVPRKGTIIAWNGNSTDPAIKLYASTTCNFENISILAPTGTTLSKGILVATKSPSTFVSSQHNWTNITVAGEPATNTLVDGVVFDSTEANLNNDTNLFHNLTVQNQTGTCVSINGGQSVLHKFWKPGCIGKGPTTTSKGFVISGSGGQFEIDGGGSSGLAVDFEWGVISSQFTTTIKDYHSEATAQFLVSGANQHSPLPITIIGGSFNNENLPAGDCAIQFATMGPLMIKNWNVLGGFVPVKICVDASVNAGSGFTFEGGSIVTSTPKQNFFDGRLPSSATGTTLHHTGSIEHFGWMSGSNLCLSCGAHNTDRINLPNAGYLSAVNAAGSGVVRFAGLNASDIWDIAPGGSSIAINSSNTGTPTVRIGHAAGSGNFTDLMFGPSAQTGIRAYTSDDILRFYINSGIAFQATSTSLDFVPAANFSSTARLLTNNTYWRGTTTAAGPQNLIGTNTADKVSIDPDAAGTVLGGALTVAGMVIHTASATPATASATCTAGQQTWDADYFYLCIAANTWRRIAHATW